MKYKLVNENFKSNYGEQLLRSRGVEDVKLFAKLTDTELVVIDENTDLYKLQSELEILDLVAKLK